VLRRIRGRSCVDATSTKSALTADTALRLGHWFGTSADMWLYMQKLYEMRLAEQEVGAVFVM
jgi:addiction module HigA family antidote